MKKKKAKRNRAAQDTTLINLRALKKRIERLEQWMAAITEDLSSRFCVGKK